MTGNRWYRAQKKEQQAWTKQYDQHMEVWLSEAHRKRKLTHLMSLIGLTSENELGGIRLLEVGGMFYSDYALAHTPARLKIVLDPLAHLWRRLSDSCHYIRCMAENIPLQDNSVDYCICTNCIDHTSSPGASLKEIARVLVAKGEIGISCNVYSGIFRPFFPVLNAIDVAHPHRFSRSTLIQLLEDSGFHILVSFPPTKPRVQGLKTLVFRIMGMRHISFRCALNR